MPTIIATLGDLQVAATAFRDSLDANPVADLVIPDGVTIAQDTNINFTGPDNDGGDVGTYPYKGSIIITGGNVQLNLVPPGDTIDWNDPPAQKIAWNFSCKSVVVDGVDFTGEYEWISAIIKGNSTEVFTVSGCTGTDLIQRVWNRRVIPATDAGDIWAASFILGGGPDSTTTITGNTFTNCCLADVSFGHVVYASGTTVSITYNTFSGCGSIFSVGTHDGASVTVQHNTIENSRACPFHGDPSDLRYTYFLDMNDTVTFNVQNNALIGSFSTMYVGGSGPGSGSTFDYNNYAEASWQFWSYQTLDVWRLTRDIHSTFTESSVMSSRYPVVFTNTSVVGATNSIRQDTGLIVDAGTSVPADGGRGWAPNCIFVVTLQAAPVPVLVNSGNFDSCAFVAITESEPVPDPLHVLTIDSSAGDGLIKVNGGAGLGYGWQLQDTHGTALLGLSDLNFSAALSTIQPTNNQALVLYSGNASTGDVGDLTIDAGAQNGAGAAGVVRIAPSNAQYVVCGKSLFCDSYVDSRAAGGGFFIATAGDGNGSFWFVAPAAMGNFVSTLTIGMMGQSTVFTVPDPGTSAAKFLLDTGTQTLVDGSNVAFGTSTGTKLGTSSSQKVSTHGVTPVAQRASANQAALGSVPTIGGALLSDVLTWITAVTTFLNTDQVLTNELRAALVAFGPIKGTA